MNRRFIAGCVFGVVVSLAEAAGIAANGGWYLVPLATIPALCFVGLIVHHFHETESAASFEGAATPRGDA